MAQITKYTEYIVMLSKSEVDRLCAYIQVEIIVNDEIIILKRSMGEVQ